MKKHLKIVALGDSMTDTGGEGYPALRKALEKVRSETEFDVYNYGVGSTRVGYGLWRLTHEYEFNNKTYAPLVSLDPDIVLVESFAYNNGSDGPREGGLEHFRDMHYQIVETLKRETNAKIVYVVTIAPDTERFLESVPSFLNTPVGIRRWMAEDRVVYLEEALKIAEELNLPVVNVYQASLDAAKQGIPLGRWITPTDWIHPGEEGHEFITENIARVLVAEGLI
jgi:lysophospholipase L1-like esterase